MGNFDDLQEHAATAHKDYVPTLARNLFRFYLLSLPLVALLAYPPIFGLNGWGVLGGIAGFFASVTIFNAYQEAHFIVKGE